MGTKQVPGKYDCHANAEIDEPLFTLLARDPTASDLVRLWAAEREAIGGDPVKIGEARQCADAMDEWRDSKLDKPARQILMGLPLEAIAKMAELRGIAVDAPLAEQTEAERNAERDRQREENAAIIRKHVRVGDVITHTRCMGIVEEHIFVGWDGTAIVGRPTPDTAVISERAPDLDTNDISPVHVTHINRVPLDVIEDVAVHLEIPKFGDKAWIPDWINDDLDFELSEQYQLADMANVGHALMQALPKGYAYNESPAEIVTDLQNQIADGEQKLARIRDALVRIVGANSADELKAMKAAMGQLPADSDDKAAILDAIDALIEISAKPLDRPSTAKKAAKKDKAKS